MIRRGPSVGASLVLVSIVVVIVLGTIPLVVSAAVDGNFSSTYDNNGQTDDPGREVRITGTLEITGSNAVDPRIIIEPGEKTLLDSNSVEVFVEGSQAVQFTERFGPSAVRLTTDEIPAGVIIELRFNVYPINYSSQTTTVQSSTVTVRYTTPEGNDQVSRFPVNTTLAPTDEFQNTLEDRNERIQQLEDSNEANEEQIEDLQSDLQNKRIWELIGQALSAMLILILGFFAVRSRFQSGGSGPK